MPGTISSLGFLVLLRKGASQRCSRRRRPTPQQCDETSSRILLSPLASPPLASPAPPRPAPPRPSPVAAHEPRLTSPRLTLQVNAALSALAEKSLAAAEKEEEDDVRQAWEDQAEALGVQVVVPASAVTALPSAGKLRGPGVDSISWAQVVRRQTAARAEVLATAAVQEKQGGAKAAGGQGKAGATGKRKAASKAKGGRKGYKKGKGGRKVAKSKRPPVRAATPQSSKRARALPASGVRASARWTGQGTGAGEPGAGAGTPGPVAPGASAPFTAEQEQAQAERLTVARRATARVLTEMGTHFRDAMAACFAMDAGEVGKCLLARPPARFVYITSYRLIFVASPQVSTPTTLCGQCTGIVSLGAVF